MTHGHSKPKTGPHAGKWATPTLSSWHNARKRCYTVNNDHYPFYGAKGVKMCLRWAKFENFLADMGERPEGTQLGRFNDIGNYEPGNVKWMDAAEQRANKRKKVKA